MVTPVSGAIRTETHIAWGQAIPLETPLDSQIHKSHVNSLISGFSLGHAIGIKSYKVFLLISGLPYISN